MVDLIAVLDSSDKHVRTSSLHVRIADLVPDLFFSFDLFSFVTIPKCMWLVRIGVHFAINW